MKSVDSILISSHYLVDIVTLLNEHRIENYAVLLFKTWELFIIDEWKTMYLVNNKVAYSSIAKAFCEALSIRFEDKWKKGYHRVVHDVSSSTYEDCFIFSFVRDPFERLVSCYEHFFNRPMGNFETEPYAKPIAKLLSLENIPITFDTFVRFVSEQNDVNADRHWRSQYDLLSNEKRNLLPHVVGRFENLNEDFDRISRLVGKKLALPHLNKSKKRHDTYREYYYYSATTMDIVQRRYKNDLKSFSY